MTSIEIGPCRLICADCRAVVFDTDADLAIADPPYGDTSLSWDKRVRFAPLARACLKPSGSMWCFGSFRYFSESFRAGDFDGWRFAQDLIWEKQNGSGNHNDRFRRVHEQAAHFYPSDVQWGEVYKNPLFTDDATARTVRRKARPPHWGEIGEAVYTSEDGGPRLMRSVMHWPNCHGFAIHPTQKPVEIIVPMVEYSCPPGGLVVDLFSGSGSVGEACILTGRRFIGVERDQEHFERSCERLRGALRAHKSTLAFETAGGAT